jgi:hypothetical protein
LKIQLEKSAVPVFGEYHFKNNGVEFRPLLSFTPGLKYEIWLAGKLLDQINIPSADANDAPVVLSVYPSPDTLPENLLKFYIRFSKPMQEGEALNHIRLIKNNSDMLSSVFLDLQPELWSNDRTMLTLWLDPGRIKRDLQPNKLLGPPLVKGNHYELLIDRNWQDARGLLLKEGFRKDFFTGIRDSISPDINKWKLEIPASGSNQSLKVHFDEALDHVLAANTMRIVDAGRQLVKGEFKLNEKEKELVFALIENWRPGKYTLEVESRLEDLTGNNLNRLFDEDLNQKKAGPKDVYTITFEVQ